MPYIGRFTTSQLCRHVTVSSRRRKKGLSAMDTKREDPAREADAAALEKKTALYLRQRELLDTFLSSGAITKAQYDKSLGDLTEKMGMRGVK